MCGKPGGVVERREREGGGVEAPESCSENWALILGRVVGVKDVSI